MTDVCEEIHASLPSALRSIVAEYADPLIVDFIEAYQAYLESIVFDPKFRGKTHALMLQHYDSLLWHLRPMNTRSRNPCPGTLFETIRHKLETGTCSCRGYKTSCKAVCICSLCMPHFIQHP